jgi:HD-like signal output (HDOD) protein
MKNWIARWFDGADAKAPAPAAAPAPEVETLFYRWLAGSPSAADLSPAGETLVLDELAHLVRTPEAAADLVPRVPAVIPQLLRSLRDEGVSGAGLARQVAQDVVLVAEVIREANSPYYRPSAPVRSIEGALMLLGQNGLRMLLARVAFRPVISMQSGRYARQVAPQVWNQSEKCAFAANLLAPGYGADPFEAYLAGLMQNVGLIVAFRLIDRVCQDGALPQSDQFCRGLLALSRTLAARIAEHWEFPPSVSHARSPRRASPAPARWRRRWHRASASPSCACCMTPAGLAPPPRSCQAPAPPSANASTNSRPRKTECRSRSRTNLSSGSHRAPCSTCPSRTRCTWSAARTNTASTRNSTSTRCCPRGWRSRSSAAS